MMAVAIPGDLPPPDPTSVMSGNGRVLVEALTRKSGKSQRAIGMYMEALRAVARSDGPECLHVAAYELREFMNALPQALDLPVVPHDQLMGKVQAFVGEWGRLSPKSENSQGGQWVGTIDNVLRGLLTSLTALVEWIEQQIPTRRGEAALVLTKLAPSANPFPEALMSLRTSEWSELLRYFNHHAHHNATPDVLEFKHRLERLEVFLLEHLEPRTFDDQDEIDRLIREVESS